LQGEGVPVTVHFNMQARLEDPVVSANVIGELRGSEHPEQVVVVGGHVDSWDVGQGAQDDGSGIMAALAAVRLIRQSGLKPKRTIRLVFWVNEENGAAGGNAYFAALSPEDLLHHVAAIEMDGGAEQPIGWGYGAAAVPLRARPGQAANLPPPALSQGEAHSLEMLRDIGSLLRPIGASTIRQGGGGTDIDPLTRAGVPGLGEMTTDAHYFDWHHTEADTFDKINLTEFRRNVGSMAVMTYVLADMPETLAGHVGASED
jgi:carboxypeptidase Q